MFTSGAGLVLPGVRDAEDCPDAKSVHPFAVAEYVVARPNAAESRRKRLRLLQILSSPASLMREAVDW